MKLSDNNLHPKRLGSAQPNNNKRGKGMFRPGSSYMKSSQHKYGPRLQKRNSSAVRRPMSAISKYSYTYNRVHQRPYVREETKLYFKGKENEDYESLGEIGRAHV